eukprot:TRINITY_DN9867_c0_g1_i1.p1 TRINITY_DN9867_c0_g1~~TRINITY_DN9867_c0_g1_i1.p1  ORF type:complete len:331 (-),score=99.78 TRINITY_DN9867_c0_g1_i1:3-884(-)
MKKEGKSDDILKALIENSTSFQTKTTFSKEKYLKKKQKKHILIVRVMKPNARLVCKTLFLKNDSRLCGLREDSLGMILTLGNIGASTTENVLIVETTSGMIAAAVAERLDGRGHILDLFIGRDTPALPFLQYIELPSKNTTDGDDSFVLHFPFSRLSEAQPQLQPVKEDEEISGATTTTAEATKRDRYEGGKKLLTHDSFDCALIVATKYEPSFILEAIYPFLAPSRPFVVFHQYAQPLADCLHELHTKRLAVNLSLREIWCREYQVLPKRTHPNMSMHDASGYILTGVKVLN